jgi:hypothetical protein
MDLPGLIQNMNTTGVFARIVNNPLAAMGTPARRYLGAELLPEKTVPLNIFQETAIKYRTVIANDASRFNPVQIKGGAIVGAMLVQLGNHETGSELTGADYDALVALLQQSTGSLGTPTVVTPPEMEAMAQVTNWADMTINRPLLEKQEKQRWDAIVNAQVIRTGDNGFTETINYPNPSGSRVTAGGQWSNNTYDPYADIIAGAEFLAAKGYTVSRMFAGTPVRSKLSLNLKFQQRVGRISIQAGTVTGVPGRVTLDVMNEQFSMDALPPLELYDLQYRTQTSSGRFLSSSVFVMVATTGRDQQIDRADLEPLILPDTIGYYGVGRATGMGTPGRASFVEFRADKPPRLRGESWETGFPVILDPEAIFVITGIS